MRLLSFIEKETICRLFGISDGFVFKYWNKQGKYNKNTSRELILEACNIDIYKDEPYVKLSQQKCVEKIFDSGNEKLISNLLIKLSEYFCFAMGDYNWDSGEAYDYEQIQKIIKRLQNNQKIELPEQTNADTKIILEDIESNISMGKPELALDRLHTFACTYIRDICEKHDIKNQDEVGNYYPIETLVAKLQKWYKDSNYFDSEFCVVAIKNTINIFAKFNDLRNLRSAAHPNKLLEKTEAEYVVKIISETLLFIDKAEKNQDSMQNEKDEAVKDMRVVLPVVDDKDLPF